MIYHIFNNFYKFIFLKYSTSIMKKFMYKIKKKSLPISRTERVKRFFHKNGLKWQYVSDVYCRQRIHMDNIIICNKCKSREISHFPSSTWWSHFYYLLDKWSIQNITNCFSLLFRLGDILYIMRFAKKLCKIIFYRVIQFFKIDKKNQNAYIYLL